MAHVRQFNGTSDVIKMALGACDLVETAYTLVVVAKITNDTEWRQLITIHDASGTARVDLERGPAGELALARSGGEVHSPFTFKEADGWCLIAVTKAKGVATPRFYKVNLTSKAVTKENGLATLGDETTASTGGDVRFGAWETFDWYKGSLQGGAIFTKALTDAQVEALAATPLSGWLALEPKGLWGFNQPVAAEGVVDLTGNGANQSSITGTTVVEEESPLPYGITFIEDEDLEFEKRTSIEVPVPPGTGKGDVVVIEAVLEANKKLAMALGTALGTQKFLAGEYMIALFTWVSDGVTTKLKITWEGEELKACEAASFTYRGVSTASPVDVVTGWSAEGGGAEGSTALACPEGTTTAAEDWLVAVGIETFGTTATAPGGMALRHNRTGGGCHTADVAQPTAGKTGVKTFTLAHVAHWVGILFALRAATASGPAMISLNPSAGVAGSSLALHAPTKVALNASAGVSTTSLKLSHPTKIQLAASAGVATTALTVAVPGAKLIPLNASAGVAAASLTLRAPTKIPLNASAGVATSSLGLTAPASIQLAASAGVSTSSLLVTTPVPLALSPSHGVSTTALVVTAAQRLVLEPAAGKATAQLTVSTPIHVALNKSAGVATATLAIHFPVAPTLSIRRAGVWVPFP